MNKIRVGIVSYLNTRPLIYGLKFPPISQQIELIEETPARLAQMLLDNKIDLGLLPIAAITDVPDYQLVGDYCIAANEAAATVCLFSEVPLEEIRTIYLDYQSRTSVELLKWLIREYWKINPELINTQDDSYRSKLNGTTAGLVIGDRAFEQRLISKFSIDLGTEWKKATGFPFVFAAWISRQVFSTEFITMLNNANALGLNHLDEIVSAHPFSLYSLKEYYTKNMSYQLTDDKKNALNYFLKSIRK